MPRVLGIDLGKNLGWAVVGQGAPRFGTIQVVSQWSPLGDCLLVLEERLHKLILQHRPDILATAIQFVNPKQATPINLIPMFSGFGILNMMAASMKLPIQMIFEGDARAAFLGRGNTPKGSANKKAAVMRACEERGWMVKTDHEADALCVASAALERTDPRRAHETTPLFQAAATMRARRPKKAA